MTARAGKVAKNGVASAGELQAMIDASLRRQRQLHGAAPTTVEAIMLSLRWRGTAALSEPDCKRRLYELNDDQVLEVAVRLQKLQSHIAEAWTAEQIKTLFETKAQLHEP
jgi:hypothetical protein